MNTKKVSEIFDVLKNIVSNLEAYKDVDATLSDETLDNVEAILEYAN